MTPIFALKYSLSIPLVRQCPFAGWISMEPRLLTAICSLEPGCRMASGQHTNIAPRLTGSTATQQTFNPRLASCYQHSEQWSWSTCGVRKFSSEKMGVEKEKSFYEIMEVHPQVSSKEIKQAFYRLSKEYHPDMNANDSTSLKKFQLVQEAYQILSNPELRAKYDKGVLGRSSSVADRERSLHTFDKESFYSSRSNLRNPDKGAKNLDAWVSKNYSSSFRKNQYQKHRRTQLGGSHSVKMAVENSQRTNATIDNSIGKLGTGLILLLIFIIFLR